MLILIIEHCTFHGVCTFTFLCLPKYRPESEFFLEFMVFKQQMNNLPKSTSVCAKKKKHFRISTINFIYSDFSQKKVSHL